MIRVMTCPSFGRADNDSDCIQPSTRLDETVVYDVLKFD